jgi:hypothetical protein
MLRRAFLRLLLPRTKPARPEEMAEVKVEPLERWLRFRMKSYKCKLKASCKAQSMPKLTSKNFVKSGVVNSPNI